MVQEAPRHGRVPVHPDFAVETEYLKRTVELIDKRIAELSRLQLTRKDWTKEAARRMRRAAPRRMESARSSRTLLGRSNCTRPTGQARKTCRIGRAAGPGVTDWRAPVASLFYARGRSSYEAPEGTVSGLVRLRRHYRIERSELLEIFDAQVADGILDAFASDADASLRGDPDVDAYLVRQLGRSAGRQIRDIVATINPNRTASSVSHRVVVLQGVAGSGKDRSGPAPGCVPAVHICRPHPGQKTCSSFFPTVCSSGTSSASATSLGVEGVDQKTIREWQIRLTPTSAATRVCRVSPGSLLRIRAFQRGRANPHRLGRRRCRRP